MKRKSVFLALILTLVALIGCTTMSQETTSPPEGETTSLPELEGRFLVAISDTDNEASAYITNQIGEPIAAKDTLSIIPLPLTENSQATTLEVTNSVWGPPSGVELTPDGRYAFVLEIKEPRQDGDAAFEEDLPYTTKISVVDLMNPTSPSIVQESDTGGFAAQSVRVNPQGDFVAVANWQGPTPEMPDIPPAQISLIPFANGQLGEAQTYAITGLEGPFVAPNDIVWHPSGEFLAATIGPRNHVVFFRLERNDDGTAMLTQYGSPVETGNFPFPARFTPDGNYLVFTEMEWSFVPGEEVSDANAPSGNIVALRFDSDDSDGITHTLTRTDDIGINPEGLDVSPDGGLAVTVNLWYSHFPEGDAKRTQASISFLRFDSETGSYTLVEEYPFDGVLPEGVTFDTSGQYVSAVVFDFVGEKAGQGAMKFWRVTEMGLEEMDYEIPLVRGAHSLDLAK